MDSTPLLILGASTRACAASARCAGFVPWCGDLFADLDLSRWNLVRRVARRDFPEGLYRVAAAPIKGPWMYTGGLENQPALIARVAARRSLLGCAAESVRTVRDPCGLTEIWRAGGCPAPAVAMDPAGLPTDGSWFWKSLRSAGGVHVEPWTATANPRSSTRMGYFQEFIRGQSAGALFLACRGTAQLLGVTAQLHGDVGASPGGLGAERPEGGATLRRFRYRGSVGPLRLSESLHAEITRLGEVVTQAAALEGLFGIDLILTADHAWPVEVNPRYCASAEVLEQAMGVGDSLVGWHVAACQGALVVVPAVRDESKWFGKWIVLAPGSAVASGAFVRRILDSNRTDGTARIADIPAPGTCFQTGDPVVTLVVSGNDHGEVVRQMAELDILVLHWLLEG